MRVVDISAWKWPEYILLSFMNKIDVWFHSLKYICVYVTIFTSCISVSCIRVSLYLYVRVSVYLCLSILCTHISCSKFVYLYLSPCIDGSPYPCISVSLYPSIAVSLYPCISVSLYLVSLKELCSGGFWFSRYPGG